MSKSAVPKIARLPRSILRRLVHRFETAHLQGLTFSHHLDWLKQQGYPVSRSLIHRFCCELRSLKAANPDQDVLDVYLKQIEQSRRCL